MLQGLVLVYLWLGRRLLFRERVKDKPIPQDPADAGSFYFLNH